MTTNNNTRADLGNVDQIMTQAVVSLDPDDTVARARELMLGLRTHGLPVVDREGHVVGIVTSSDLVETWPDGEPVDEIMSAHVHAVEVGTTVRDAAATMRANKIHHLLVTRKRQPVGIISSFDILRAVAPSEPDDRQDREDVAAAGAAHPVPVFDTVVVGTDGSDDAEAAVQMAVDLVRINAGARLHVVNASRPLSPGEIRAITADLPSEYRDLVTSHFPSEAVLTRARSAARAASVDAVFHEVDDHPADALLDVVDRFDADLLVVGSRGEGRARRLVHGSVSTSVMHHAPCSVLVVHGPAVDAQG